MKKRILSLLLAIVMVLGMVPVFAMAEEATTEPITIDFKQFAADASTQTWWEALPQGSDGTTRWIGASNSGGMGFDWTEAGLAAYDSMLQFMKDNYDWYLDESVTKLKNATMATSSTWKGMYITNHAKCTFGISLYSAQLEKAAADFAFVVNVDEAGLYQLDMTAFYEGTSGGTHLVTASGLALAGSGYFDLLVNGTQVVDDYKLYGNTDDGNLNATLTTTLATVVLQEGENTITVRPSKDLNGVQSSHRRHINLKSLALTKVGECDHSTDSANDYYCDTCGALIAPEGTYFIDFKHFAKAAAQQTWWADMKQDAGTNDAVIGAWTGWFSAAMTETETAAYDSMIEFMKANYAWYLDETATGLKSTTIKKGFWMAGDDYAPWGMSFYAASLNSAASDFAFKLDVAEAGYYDLDMKAFYEGTTGATKIPFYTGGNDSNSGYVDIVVNGKTVLDDHNTNGQGQTYQNTIQNVDIGAVYLEAGENTITVRPAADNGGAFSSHRRYINLQSLELNYIAAECPHEVGETNYICDICGEAVLATDSMEIATEADLIEFSDLVNAGATELNATLTADIALTEAWITNLTVNKAIGTAEAPYSGTFDGQATPSPA